MYIPDKCFALLNSSINPKTGIGTLILIKALEHGYYEQDYRTTQEEVDERNEQLGVTKEEAKAMATASIFGWQSYISSLEVYSKRKEKTNEQ